MLPKIALSLLGYIGFIILVLAFLKGAHPYRSEDRARLKAQGLWPPAR